MLTPVKTIVPVRIAIAICLMIFFAIHTLEDVRIWLTDFGSHTVEFFIFSATLHLFSVMFGRMSSIVTIKILRMQYGVEQRVMMI